MDYSNPAPSEPNDALRKLRHDVRNALAPAMMTADLLSASTDPDVARRAETIIKALETATVLLKNSATSAR